LGDQPVPTDWRKHVPNGERIVTAELPSEPLSKFDEIAQRTHCSKSWIIRQALAEWLAEKQRRFELTLEALKDIDEGRFYTQEEVELYVAKKNERRERLPTEETGC
jgi:predicted transcriptional regulator